MKNAYQALFNGQKLYFDYSFAGLKAIQKLAHDFNTTIKYKFVKVNANKNLITL
jgi:hypothetical protein